jgi:hypothetical protein
MTQSGVTFHMIFDELYTETDKANTVELIRDFNPRWFTVVGGGKKPQAFAFARDLKSAFPNTRVIFRNHPDDGNWVKLGYQKPENWYLAHLDYLQAGLTVLTDNESVTADMQPYGQWSADIMDLAGPNGHSVAVGRTATGNPDDGSQGNPHYQQLDPMWKALARWGTLHPYSPNEYFGKTPQESGGHVARYLNAWKRCQQIGVPNPLTVIGEFGYVRHRPDGSVDAWQGWSGLLSAQVYASMVVGYFSQWYRPNNVDVHLFSLGKWNQGPSYNVI